MSVKTWDKISVNIVKPAAFVFMAVVIVNLFI